MSSSNDGGSSDLNDDDRTITFGLFRNLGLGSMAAIVAGSAFVLFLFIFAIYKYCNREEGTYRIDESKNCGPFAELDMPLNSHHQSNKLTSSCSNSSSFSGKKSSKKNRRTGNSNKEWFV
jgi:hypothetical protein